jgi:transaldolase
MYILPFIGQLDDIGTNGFHLLHELKIMRENYHSSTKILAASLRSVSHLQHAAFIAVDAAMVPICRT